MNLRNIKILILGNGQLGQAFYEALPEATQWTRENFDFSRVSDFFGEISNLNPDMIINTIAYTHVDQAEQNRETAEQLNHKSVADLSSWVATNQKMMIHFSTDYVYGGSGSSFFTEDSALNPLNYYGETKARGDLAVLSSGAQAWIFRVSWIFSSEGTNFVKTMLRLFQKNEMLNVVSDQIGSPTSAQGIVRSVLSAFEKALPADTYHLRSDAVLSWYEFALLILEMAQKLGYDLNVQKINAISSSQYPTSAKRPLNSRLNTDKIEKYIELPDLKEDLMMVLSKMKEKHGCH